MQRLTFICLSFLFSVSFLLNDFTEASGTPQSVPTRKPWTIRPTIPRNPKRASFAPHLAPTSIPPMPNPTLKPNIYPTVNNLTVNLETRTPSNYRSSFPTSRLNIVLLSPSAAPVRITEKQAQFSNYVFFGDATLQYMLCYTAGQSPPANYVNCSNYFDNYFANSLNMPINCSTTSSNLYCSSAFYAAFPGAINFALGNNARIDNVTTRVLSYPAVSRLANIMVPANMITDVVVSVGWNDIPASPNTPAARYIPMYNALLRAINKKFPKAQILLLGIRPLNFTAGSIAVLRNNINNIMNSTYNKNPLFPFVRFLDFTSYFNINGIRDASAFITPVHFSSRGYGYLEKAIKDTIENFRTFPSVVPSVRPSFTSSINTTSSTTIPSAPLLSSMPTRSPSAIALVSTVSPFISLGTFPSQSPTTTPTCCPTSIPSTSQSCRPTLLPSICPVSVIPTTSPSSDTLNPMVALSSAPFSSTSSFNPSAVFTTITPAPSSRLSSPPSNAPGAPMAIPSVGASSWIPTKLPFEIALVSTATPSFPPTISFSPSPTRAPTCCPTLIPSTSQPCRPTLLPSVCPVSVIPTTSPSSDTLNPMVALSSTPFSSTSSFNPSAVFTTITPAPSSRPSSPPSNAPGAPMAIPSAGASSWIPTKLPFEIALVSTATPSFPPTISFSPSPTRAPTCCPTSITSTSQSCRPTLLPSICPVSVIPTTSPSSDTLNPMVALSSTPSSSTSSFNPSAVFTTIAPAPSSRPSSPPSNAPGAPMAIPSAGASSWIPTKLPFEIALVSTATPSFPPTISFSPSPTRAPTCCHTSIPSTSQSCRPTLLPSICPVSVVPTCSSSFNPSVVSTISPSVTNTTPSIGAGSFHPTNLPSAITLVYTISPSISPTTSPLPSPSASPSFALSSTPTLQSCQPTILPSMCPASAIPTVSPFSVTFDPIVAQSIAPSSLKPSFIPSALSSVVAVAPSIYPSSISSDIDFSRSPTASPSPITLAPSASPSVSSTITFLQSPTAAPTCCPFSTTITLVPTPSQSISPITSPCPSTSARTWCPSLTPSSLQSGQQTSAPSYLKPPPSPTVTPSSILLSTRSPSSIAAVLTAFPSICSTISPSSSPANEPTCCPSLTLSSSRSCQPTSCPSICPTSLTSVTFNPMTILSTVPSSMNPSFSPSAVSPSQSNKPTMPPSLLPISLKQTSSPSSLISNSEASLLPTSYPLVAPSLIKTIAPSTHPSVALSSSWSSTAKFDNYMFLGSSIVTYWLCFKPGFPSTTRCVDYSITYFEVSSRLMVNCTNIASGYCSSFFQSEFPGALNFAVPGATIETSMSRMETYPPIARVANRSVPCNNITRIITYLGNNDLFRGVQVKDFVPIYYSYLESIHSKFPDAQIMVLSVLPHLYSPSLYRDFLSSAQGRVNSLLHEAFNINKTLVYVSFANQMKFLYPNDTLNTNLFIDPLHLSAEGYSLFAASIKAQIDNIWT